MRNPILLRSLPLCLILGACANLERDYERPKVDLVGITKSETGTISLQ